MSPQLLERLVYRQPKPDTNGWHVPITIGQRLAGLGGLLVAATAAHGAALALYTELLHCWTWSSCTGRGLLPATLLAILLAAVPLLLTGAGLRQGIGRATRYHLVSIWAWRWWLWIAAAVGAGVYLLVWAVKQLVQLL